MGSESGLSIAVTINEAAKSMSDLGHQVRLCALDAQVRNAKDHSANLAGFREVSLQMRRWSDDLASQLDRLRALCADSVKDESAYRTLQRKATLLKTTAATCHNDALGGCVREISERDAEARHRRRAALARTLVELDDLRQLGMMAIVLSRTAAIEASGADPEERAVLAQVANEFGAHAEAVVKLGKALVPMARAAQGDA